MEVVATMKPTAAHSTPLASPRSSKKPNRIGPMTPPTLKPVETIPKVLPSAPAGDAARTSFGASRGCGANQHVARSCHHAGQKTRSPQGEGKGDGWQRHPNH